MFFPGPGAAMETRWAALFLKFGMYHVVCNITPHFENRPLIEFPFLCLWIATETNFGFLINIPTSGLRNKLIKNKTTALLAQASAR